MSWLKVSLIYFYAISAQPNQKRNINTKLPNKMYENSIESSMISSKSALTGSKAKMVSGQGIVFKFA